MFILMLLFSKRFYFEFTNIHQMFPSGSFTQKRNFPSVRGLRGPFYSPNERCYSNDYLIAVIFGY